MVFGKMYEVLIAGIEVPRLLASGLYSYAGAEADSALGEETLMIVVPSETDDPTTTIANPEIKDKVQALSDEMKFQSRKESKRAVELGVFAAGILEGLSERLEQVLTQYINSWGGVRLNQEVSETSTPRVTLLSMVLCVTVSETINEIARMLSCEQLPLSLKTPLEHIKKSLSHLLDTLYRVQTEIYCKNAGGIEDA
ncbi:MAG: hypothetical protein KO464_02300 [Candidatus Methanofastidiosum sp.]|nr:hypothetical protein [Methanofastidiosum sp.]